MKTAPRRVLEPSRFVHVAFRNVMFQLSSVSSSSPRYSSWLRVSTVTIMPWQSCSSRMGMPTRPFLPETLIEARALRRSQEPLQLPVASASVQKKSPLCPRRDTLPCGRAAPRHVDHRLSAAPRRPLVCARQARGARACSRLHATAPAPAHAPLRRRVRAEDQVLQTPDRYRGRERLRKDGAAASRRGSVPALTAHPILPPARALLRAQSIIECLKLACCGTYPADSSRGRLFVHDVDVGLARASALVPPLLSGSPAPPARRRH